MTPINMTLVYNSYSYLSILQKSVPEVEWNSVTQKLSQLEKKSYHCKMY